MHFCFSNFRLLDCRKNMLAFYWRTPHMRPRANSYTYLFLFGGDAEIGDIGRSGACAHAVKKTRIPDPGYSWILYGTCVNERNANRVLKCTHPPTYYSDYILYTIIFKKKKVFCLSFWLFGAAFVRFLHRDRSGRARMSENERASKCKNERTNKPPKTPYSTCNFAHISIRYAPIRRKESN